MKKVILLTLLCFFYLPKGEGQEIENAFDNAIALEFGAGMQHNDALFKPFDLPLCFEGCEQISSKGKLSTHIFANIQWPIKSKHHIITGIYFQKRIMQQELRSLWQGNEFTRDLELFYFGGQIGHQYRLYKANKWEIALANSALMEYNEHFHFEGIGFNYLSQLKIGHVNNNGTTIAQVSPFFMLAILAYPNVDLEFKKQYRPIAIGVSVSIKFAMKKK